MADDAGTQPSKKSSSRKDRHDYYPLSDTLRLYAGWLLAWYFLIYAVGEYQLTRTLPFHVPLLSDLFFSPLILHFAAAAFLYLFLSSIHRLLGRRIIVGVLLTIIGLLLYGLFRMYA